jgi:hypothetical protein
MDLQLSDNQQLLVDSRAVSSSAAIRSTQRGSIC